MDIKIEYLLALMIYSNYAQLQSKFTKTYLQNQGQNHAKFYHWVVLKISLIILV